MPELAFIGHLSTPRAYREALQSLRGDDLPLLGEASVARVLARTSPMPLCHRTVHSSRGTSVTGVFIDLFLLVEGDLVGDGRSLAALLAAAQKVRSACALAARLGARIGALGGFSSIIGEQKRLNLATAHGIPFTTGNTLTAAVVARQVEQFAAPGDDVVVLGAAGDVGSGVCRALADRGHRLVLVGRTQESVAPLAAELGAQTADWADASARADVAVLVASTEAGAIDLSRLRRDAVVLDAGHPPNAGVGETRVFRAGRVQFAIPPTGGLPQFVLQDVAPDQGHSCLAEAAVLAFEDRYESYSIGRGNITAERAEEILELAARHGVEPVQLGDSVRQKEVS